MKPVVLMGVFAIAGIALGGSAVARPLEIQVIPTSVTSLYANVVLLKGEKTAVLVDVPFSRADAYRVVAEILDGGKPLEAIIITHDHPDHFFGLDVLTDAFPAVQVLADPAVVKDITRSIPTKFKRWSPVLGMNAPRRQVVPIAISSGQVLLEGHTLKIIGPMQGDHVHATAVWDSESRTLVAGDLLYNGVFAWLGEHREPQYSAWLKSLDVLQALKPLRLVAGHTRPGIADDSYAIEWTRQYILAFSQAASETKSSKDLAATLHTLYPNAVDVAGDFLVGVSSQVAVGEIPPWNE